MKERLIYESKYPRIDHVSQYEHDITEAEMYPSAPNPTYRDFYHGIRADIQYTIIPTREKMSEEFIKKIIEVSELYQIDARIIQHKYKVSVQLDFDFGTNMHSANRLFGMADRISFFKGSNEHDISVRLDLYTHVVVKNGLSIAP